MITSDMLARQITLLDSLPATLTPLLRYSYKLFCALKEAISFGIKQIQTLLIKHPVLGTRSLRPLTPASLLSSLLLITYVQATCFHAITHSFAQRESSILPVFSCFCTLSIATGVGTPSTSVEVEWLRLGKSRR